VLLVILDHFRATVWIRMGGDPEVWLAASPITMYGWTGVDLFFVLSGFLIGQQIWREKQQTGGLRIGRFLLRRGFRIWPLYFVTLAALQLGPGGLRPEWSDWLLLSNYAGTAYARSWSLSTEEHFYLAAPLLLLLTRGWSLGRYVPTIVAALCATVVGRYLSASALARTGASPRAIDEALYAPFHLHNEGLLVGLLVALAFTLRPDWFDRSVRSGPVPAGTLAAAAMMALGVALHAVSSLLFAYTALGLIFGGALVFVLTHRSAIVTRVTDLWIWHPLARLSYGMYLNHVIFGKSLTMRVIAWSDGHGLPAMAGYGLGLAVAIALSVALSVVTFVLVERPFLLLRDVCLSRSAASRTLRPALADTGSG